MREAVMMMNLQSKNFAPGPLPTTSSSTVQCCNNGLQPYFKFSISPLMVLVAIFILSDVPGAGLTTLGERTRTLTTTTSMTSSSGIGGGGVVISGTPSPYIEPFKLNTTAFAGQTAYLPCVVRHLGDHKISWIRQRDLHILTSGHHVYTNDPRVSLSQGKLHNSWTLKITAVQKKDSGAYQCQVNTIPEIKATLYLTVFGSLSDDSKMKVAGWRMQDSSSPVQLDSKFETRPKVTEARIFGPLQVEIVEGSHANFTCMISHPGLSPPTNVTWYHQDVPVKENSVIRGGINIETEKSLFHTISHLIIVRIGSRDAGKYSCGGTNIYPASVALRVFPRHSRHSHTGVNEPRPMVSGGVSSSIANSVPSHKEHFYHHHHPHPPAAAQDKKKMHLLLITLPTLLLCSS